MKNKGVLISMAVILVIGILITKSTHNFIERGSSGTEMAADQAMTEAIKAVAEEETLADQAGVAAAAAAEPFMAEGGIVAYNMEAAEDVPQEDALLMDDVDLEAKGGTDYRGGISKGSTADSDMGDVNLTTDGAVEEGKAAQTEALAAAITPLDPPTDTITDEITDGEANLSKDASVPESQSYYKKRLQDLDNQIEKSRNSKNSANANNSARSTATNELKLWDSELNSIYNAILENLDRERSEELVEQQRAWLKERDSTAMEAAKNSSGGFSESLEYTVSLIESTRARAYELAELYKVELE